MKIKFCGAAGEVTGSCHLLDFDDQKVLLDCGIYQGKRAESYSKNRNFLFDPTEIDNVVLSHAHIDHSGNIPTLFKKGFQGNIYSTFATRDLCLVMLEDSAYIQSLDEKYYDKLKSKGLVDPIEAGPLYDYEHVDMAMKSFMGISYHQKFFINKYLKGTFYDAGHVLGSAIGKYEINHNNKNIRLGFTGDLGRYGLPILRDPEQLQEIDYLIMESTYGDRTHDDASTAQNELKEAVLKTIKRGGKIIIPAFALERTQELIYHLHILWHNKEIPNLDVFVDSPLAINVTNIFKMHPECYDKETKKEFTRKHNPFGFEYMKYTSSVEESKALNFHKDPCIIISASGMCEAGRIRHHLYNNLEDERNTILVVGYMAQNTLGRKIVEKKPEIRIFDKMLKVKAEIVTLNAFSAHADMNGLYDYVKNCQGLKKVFLVHGEAGPQEFLGNWIKNELGIEVHIAERGEEVELI